MNGLIYSVHLQDIKNKALSSDAGTERVFVAWGLREARLNTQSNIAPKKSSEGVLNKDKASVGARPSRSLCQVQFHCREAAAGAGAVICLRLIT